MKYDTIDNNFFVKYSSKWFNSRVQESWRHHGRSCTWWCWLRRSWTSPPPPRSPAEPSWTWPGWWRRSPPLPRSASCIYWMADIDSHPYQIAIGSRTLLWRRYFQSSLNLALIQLAISVIITCHFDVSLGCCQRIPSTFERVSVNVISVMTVIAD